MLGSLVRSHRLGICSPFLAICVNIDAVANPIIPGPLVLSDGMQHCCTASAGVSSRSRPTVCLMRVGRWICVTPFRTRPDPPLGVDLRSFLLSTYTSRALGSDRLKTYSCATSFQLLLRFISSFRF